MYKYIIRIDVTDIDREGRNKISGLLEEDKGKREVLSMDSYWYYLYIEYEQIHDADNLVNTLLKIKEVQKEYPNNSLINECYIVTNKFTIN